MSFQLILSPLFLKPQPFPHTASGSNVLIKVITKHDNKYFLSRSSSWLSRHLGFIKSIKPFLAIVPILYPLKTPEGFWYPGVFRRYKMSTLARMGQYKQVPNQCYVII